MFDRFHFRTSVKIYLDATFHCLFDWLKVLLLIRSLEADVQFKPDNDF